MKIAVIPADGTAPIRFEEVHDSLKLLQENVGGKPSGVRLPAAASQQSEIILYSNENGSESGLPRNHRATMIYQIALRRSDVDLYGDVVAYGSEDSDGNRFGLEEAQVKDLERIQRLTED